MTVKGFNFTGGLSKSQANGSYAPIGTGFTVQQMSIYGGMDQSQFRLLTVLVGHTISSSGQFNGWLDDFRRWNYTTITPDDLYNFLMGNVASLPAKPLLITFDDGYPTQWANAWPGLQARNMKFTIYVATDWIDGLITQGQGQFLEATPITWAQLNTMFASGLCRVQAHSVDHQSYGIQLAAGACAADFLAAKARIETMVTGETVNHMAYPFGATSQAVIANLRANAASLHTARTVTAGDGASAFVTPQDDPLWVPCAGTVNSADVYQANYMGRLTPNPQMIANQGFEAGSGAGCPGWTLSSAATLDAAQKHSGAQSLKIPQATTTQDNTQSDQIFIAPFGQVTVTWWAMTSGLPASTVHANLETFDANGAHLTTNLDRVAAIGGTTGWTQYSFTFTGSTNTWAVKFHISVDLNAAPAGSVWIDDVTLTRNPGHRPLFPGVV